MIIRQATFDDIKLIGTLAHDIWWPTYRDILDSDQISLMLEDMYSEDALEKQMNEGIIFFITENEARATGFAAYSLIDNERMLFKLHKIYMLPSEQGKGGGKKLIEYISGLIKEQGGKVLELNVNRSNPAYTFYKKLGFSVHQLVDIPYYQYFLNDYVMRKEL